MSFHLQIEINDVTAQNEAKRHLHLDLRCRHAVHRAPQVSRSSRDVKAPLTDPLQRTVMLRDIDTIERDVRLLTAPQRELSRRRAGQLMTSIFGLERENGRRHTVGGHGR